MSVEKVIKIENMILGKCSLDIDNMLDKIKIRVGDIELEGELNDTECAEYIKDILPVEEEFKVWGDEFYFSIGLELPLEEDAQAEVPVGTIGYWPSGQALAIFFGPTPASTGEKPVAASAVNRVGKVNNPEKLKEVKDADHIEIEPL